jgi:hypothetical protein
MIRKSGHRFSERIMLKKNKKRDLVPSFRLDDGLPDFGAAVGALIDEVDLRHVPMRLDVPHMHREQSDAAGTDNRRRLEDFVMPDIGWHGSSPSQRK